MGEQRQQRCEEERFFLGPEFGVTQSLGFNPDGKVLASGWKNGTVVLYDVAQGKERHRLKGHEDKVRSLAFGPGGAVLASVSPDSTVRLWDVAAGKGLYVLTGRTPTVSGVALSPEGKPLAAGARGGAARPLGPTKVAASGRERGRGSVAHRRSSRSRPPTAPLRRR